jgi:hypothetical protein
MFFSEKVRVYRTVQNIDIYTKYQNMQSMTPALLKNYRLCDFYVSSSYNSASSGYQMFDYISANVVKKILQTGARYLEFQVYGDQFGEKGEPVVSMGFKTGEWKLSLNTVYFEDIITIKDSKFGRKYRVKILTPGEAEQQRNEEILKNLLSENLVSGSKNPATTYSYADRRGTIHYVRIPQPQRRNYEIVVEEICFKLTPADS